MGAAGHRDKNKLSRISGLGYSSGAFLAINLSPFINISHKTFKPIKDAPVCKEQVVELRVVACQHQSPSCLLRVAELQVTTRTEGRGHQD